MSFGNDCYWQIRNWLECTYLYLSAIFAVFPWILFFVLLAVISKSIFSRRFLEFSHLWFRVTSADFCKVNNIRKQCIYWLIFSWFEKITLPWIKCKCFPLGLLNRIMSNDLLSNFCYSGAWMMNLINVISTLFQRYRLNLANLKFEKGPQRIKDFFSKVCFTYLTITRTIWCSLGQFFKKHKAYAPALNSGLHCKKK